MKLLTVITYVLMSFLVGSVFICLSLGFISPDAFTNYIKHYFLSDTWPAFSLGLIGFLVILFCIRYIQKAVFSAHRDRAIVLDSEEGSVSITISAIEDLIRKLLEGKDSISHIRPRITNKKNEVFVNVRVYLTSELNLLEFSRQIQERVKEKLQLLLGEEKDIHVMLAIRKVVSSAKIENEPEAEVPFRNY